MVAIAVGIAGSFALTRRDVSNIVAGVAIAISLVPVLAVVGITLAAAGLDLATGAFLLFLTNVAAILIAGVIVFRAARYFREAMDRAERAGRRARIFIVVLLVVLLVPLGASSVQILLLPVVLQRRREGHTGVARRHRLGARGRLTVGQRARHHGDRAGLGAAAGGAQGGDPQGHPPRRSRQHHRGLGRTSEL